jgi:hypothetical protein
MAPQFLEYAVCVRHILQTPTSRQHAPYRNHETIAWLLIIILYIPAACTSKLQPCDLVHNRTVKHEAAEAFAEQFAQALYGFAGTAEERTAFVKAVLATSTLKPLLALFVRQGVQRVKEQ